MPCVSADAHCYESPAPLTNGVLRHRHVVVPPMFCIEIIRRI